METLLRQRKMGLCRSDIFMISIKQWPRNHLTESKNNKIAEESKDGDVTRPTYCSLQIGKWSPRELNWLLKVPQQVTAQTASSAGLGESAPPLTSCAILGEMVNLPRVPQSSFICKMREITHTHTDLLMHSARGLTHTINKCCEEKLVPYYY